MVDSQLKLTSQSESQEYVVHRANEKEQILRRIETSRKRKEAKKIVDPSERFQFMTLNPPNLKETLTVTAPKSKIKTRAEIQSSPPVIEEVEHSQVHTLVLYTFSPTSKAAKVISLLFPEADNIVEGKTLKRTELESAMKNLGFHVYHGGGSAFTFKGDIKLSPDQPDQNRSIVIHQPHPEPQLDTVLLGGLGKRLSKWFGWERGNFDISHRNV